MNINEFKLKYDIDLSEDLFDYKNECVFYIEDTNNIFNSSVINIKSSLQKVTNYEKIDCIQDLFDKLNPIHELVIDSSSASYIHSVKFKLKNTSETCYIPVSNGNVYGIILKKYYEKNIVLGYCTNYTYLFDSLSEYIMYAFKDKKTQLFNENMLEIHISQTTSTEDMYFATIDISNMFEHFHAIDNYGIKKLMIALADLLYRETYSKVCVYHLSDKVFALKTTLLDKNEVESILEKLVKEISQVRVNGFIPKPYIGYVYYDPSIILNKDEIVRFSYIATMLAHKNEHEVYYLDGKMIKYYISKYDTALETIKELELKDF